MIRCWLPALLATLGLATPPVLAQTSYPMLMSLKPVAAQVGQTSEHTVTSRYNLFGAYQVLVSGTGVTAEVVPVKKSKDGKEPSLTSLKLKFTVAPDALSALMPRALFLSSIAFAYSSCHSSSDGIKYASQPKMGLKFLPSACIFLACNT